MRQETNIFVCDVSFFRPFNSQIVYFLFNYTFCGVQRLVKNIIHINSISGLLRNLESYIWISFRKLNSRR